MEPVVRIQDHGVVAIHIQGLNAGLTTILKQIAGPPHGTIHEAASAASPGSHPKHPDAGEHVPLTGTPEQIRHILSIIEKDDRIPPEITKTIRTSLDNVLRTDYKISCRGTILDLGSRTHIMGILNVTPDSFSDGGLFLDADTAARHAREMAAHGADILDIGGESTRPGAQSLTEDDELRRIIPVIRRLAQEVQTPLSVDTYKSAVAKKALEEGASIVNDISGLRFSPDMARVVADHGAAVVIMHIKGTPRDMQQDPVYTDVVSEVMAYLGEGIERALKAGIAEEQILIDPGIGFGKTVGHNLALLNRLGEFRILGRPILLGTSRKSFIGSALGITDPGLRAEGTAATVALGIERGAQVLRVHDVGPMARVARMTDAILKMRAGHPE